LTATSWVQFGTADTADKFIKQAHRSDRSLKAGDQAITIKRARTDLQSLRNNSVRKAEELIKASPYAHDKVVEIKWTQKDREVTVNGSVAFSQARLELGGSFRAPFQDLVLP
jgi:hypothetical protein